VAASAKLISSIGGDVVREKSSGDIQSVDRVAQLLSLFTVQRPQVSIAEAAALVGLNRTTVARYFGSMLSADLLERSQDDPTSYVLGRLTLQLGAVAQGQRRILDLVPRHLRLLARQTELTAVLSTLGRFGPFVSMVSEVGSPALLVTVRVGTVLSWDSAQGLLFLQFSKDTEASTAYSDALTQTDRRTVWKNAAATAARGLAWHQEAAFGTAVLAAPVFDDHELVGTVALLGTIAKLPPDSEFHAEMLLRTAAALTSELGGTDVWRANIEQLPGGGAEFDPVVSGSA